MHLPQATYLAIMAGLLAAAKASPAPSHIDISVEAIEKPFNNKAFDDEISR